MAPRILFACLAVAALAAGCGAGAARQPAPHAPKLPRMLAESWARAADQVAAAEAAGDGCRARQLAQSLGADVSANAGAVPSRLRTPLVTAVTTLVDRIACTPPPKKPKPHGPPPDHGHGHGHGGKGPGGDQGGQG